MKTACISTSNVPSSTANSIQLMKACHALAQVDGPLRLYVPENGVSAADRSWEKLAEIYGLTQPFEVCWLPAIPALKRYDFAWNAVRQARAWQAGRIVTWTPQAAVLAVRAGIPTLLEVHDSPTGRIGPWLYQQFIRRGSRRPAPRRLLVITEALLRKLRVQFEPQFGCQLEPQLVEDLQNIDVQIAPNGVDLSQYEDLPDAPAARRRLNLPERITVVYSGHFYAGRGMDLLYGLAKRFAQVQFLWIGGREEDVSAWRSRLEAEKMENVILTGFLSQRVLPFYQAAGDILLMPYERSIAGSSGGNSADICSPMKMFDYLAAGRVILSSDLPVFHEILNETNAVFAPPQALEAWSQALQALIDDEPLRLRLSAQARQDARKYTWQERASRAIQNF